EDRYAALDGRLGLGVGALVRRSDGDAYERPYFVAPVRSDGCDGGANLVRDLRDVPRVESHPCRCGRRLDPVLSAMDGAALELQRQRRARVPHAAPDRLLPQ